MGVGDPSGLVGPVGPTGPTGATGVVSFGTNNTRGGTDALLVNTTGFGNTGFGVEALGSNTTGTSNTAHGALALNDNTTGSNNTATGTAALRFNTTGVFNTANGTAALPFNTTGSANTATGHRSLRMNTTGGNNTASGAFAMYANTIGFSNTASGHRSLQNNSTGDFNTAVGYHALFDNTTGNRNTALGHAAGSDQTTGSYNIAIDNYGYAGDAYTTRIGTAGNQTKAFIAGIRGVTTDNDDAFAVMVDSAGQLGATDLLSVDGTNGLVGIGTSSALEATLHVEESGTGVGLLIDELTATQASAIELRNTTRSWFVSSDSSPDELRIAEDGITRFQINAGGNVGIGRDPATNALEVAGTASKSTAGSWLANSDRRIKTHVRNLDGALESIEKVRVVGFRYAPAYLEQHPRIEDIEYFNVIAQEFAEVFPDYVQDSGEEGLLQVDTYPALIHSIAAVQELSAKSRELEARVYELERVLSELLSGR